MADPLSGRTGRLGAAPVAAPIPCCDALQALANLTGVRQTLTVDTLPNHPLIHGVWLRRSSVLRDRLSVAGNPAPPHPALSNSDDGDAGSSSDDSGSGGGSDHGSSGGSSRCAPASPAQQLLQEEACPSHRPPPRRVADLSGGRERVPVRVVNDVNDEPLPELEEYLMDHAYAPGIKEEVAEHLEREATKMRAFRGGAPDDDCGVQANARMVEIDARARVSKKHATSRLSYTVQEGLLDHTHLFGVHECGDRCQAAGPQAKPCRMNRQVSNGLRLPLEVFMTEDRGYGVRCLVDIPGGAFIVAYLGELTTSWKARDVAEGEDLYLMSLDHFTLLSQFIVKEGMAEALGGRPAHQLPPPPHYATCQDMRAAAAHATAAAAAGAAASTSAQGSTAGRPPAADGAASTHPSDQLYLVADGSRRGNVSRFINHGCEGNVQLQPVFARDARSTLLYYPAMYAARYIPAGEELQYDYKYPGLDVAALGDPELRTLECKCGAPNCCRVLWLGS